MKMRGQGALEYLLIIGGAIVVAAIVLMVLGGTSASGVSKQQANALCAPYTQTTCATADPDGNSNFALCTWDSVGAVCVSKNCGDFNNEATAMCPAIHCKVVSGACTTK